MWLADELETHDFGTDGKRQCGEVTGPWLAAMRGCREA
jgi:hypothetical protein